MATITTLDQIVAGAQPLQYFAKPQGAATTSVPVSFYGLSGNPGAGSFNTTLAGGIYSSSSALVPGQIPHTDPAAGINSYLNRFCAAVTPFSSVGLLYLCDRLWDNGGITLNSTSAQTINSPTWPARDANGATTGTGVLLGLEISSTVSGGATPTVAISYTNSFGASGRVTGGLDPLVTGSIAGTLLRISWHSGDAGVQSVQSLTFSGSVWTAGTANLVAYRVITALAVPQTGVSVSQDCVTGALPRLYNGVVPFLVWVGSTTPVGLSGIYQEVQI